ncbi:hypothetical protein [Rhizobium favelukesii]|uniref:Uncharacterized protein n=1 Tax=Rhizobium favelukesii TaxID=348824 RepID=W6R7Y9_9HYPH|nr:hypothetical protein [Rhizobium favelukesii]MCS0459296.1 hypothetical protein [Rhizobium favelukesii]CDM57402.1 putative predicted protein [Rhizobium favelukesii]
MSPNLPEIFKAIIAHDNMNPANENVVRMSNFTAWRKRKRELVDAAAGYAKRQRSGK